MAYACIGIDPGKSGGVAWILDCGTAGRGVEAYPLERMTRAEIIEFMVERGDVFTTVFIEKVHSTPQMGVKSAFTFGQAYERVLMAAVAAGLSLEVIPPKEWQKAVGLVYPKNTSHTQHKRLSRDKAQQLYPEAKVTNATADAILIAHAGCLLRSSR